MHFKMNFNFRPPRSYLENKFPFGLSKYPSSSVSSGPSTFSKSLKIQRSTRNLGYTEVLLEHQVVHPSGQRYLGMTVPLDLDKFLIDSTRDNVDRSFPIFNEKDFESKSKRSKY